MPVAKDTRPTYTHNYGNTALHVCRLAYWLAAMTAPIAAYHAKLSTLCTLISELCIQAAGEQDWSIWSWRRRIRSGEYLCTAPSPPPGGRNSAPTARSKWGIYRNVLELHDCCAYCLVICSTNTYKMFVCPFHLVPVLLSIITSSRKNTLLLLWFCWPIHWVLSKFPWANTGVATGRGDPRAGLQGRNTGLKWGGNRLEGAKKPIISSYQLFLRHETYRWIPSDLFTMATGERHHVARWLYHTIFLPSSFYSERC